MAMCLDILFLYMTYRVNQKRGITAENESRAQARRSDSCCEFLHLLYICSAQYMLPNSRPLSQVLGP